MQIIDEILELAKSLEPSEKIEPTFSLKFENNEWYGKVGVLKFYVDAKGTTMDEVLNKMHKELLHYNQSLLAKITNRIKHLTKTYKSKIFN